MDVAFHHGDAARRRVFGLAEHATRFALPHTTGPRAHYTEPFRLYNLDVFEYELDEPMALYGAIPLVVSHSTGAGAGAGDNLLDHHRHEQQPKTVGALWLNPSETFVDVGEVPCRDGLDDGGDGADDTDTRVRWISESGVVDLLLLPGPTPRDFYKQYGRLTGTQVGGGW